ncbi:GlgB N-terminal domain-containing protein, partial [Streptomyces sp. SAS_270]|uniref:GlgB N-terminal domain-containing protein n=1 Tax=Streptomyces sp. SAS_270 TaxID=3412748 RepID=UPI00403D4298
MTPRPPSDDSPEKNGTSAKKTAATPKKAAASAKKKTAGAEKAPAKKAAAKEPVPKKTVAKKAAVKKTAGGKPAAEKAIAKKAVAKKVPAKKTAVKKTVVEKRAQPRVAEPVVVGNGSAVLEGEDRERLLGGTHHDPHGVLGAHPVAEGVAFRALRPYALSVTVVMDDLRAQLRDDGDGFFSGVLPLRAVPEAYRLEIAYEGSVLETEDAYRFLPAISGFDLHLLGEGRHEQLWKALGAEPMVHQGVTGTRFTVWAPNARGVRLAGTFNFWDGTGYPMRSLGGSGVWELFVPSIGEGELYKFDITRPDGTHTLRADPVARRTEVPPNTSSVVHASHHTWRDEDWMDRRAGRPVHEAPFSVYEVHLPSWRPG